MNIALILTEFRVSKFDFYSLANVDYQFILVTTPKLVKSLTEHELNFFTKVHLLEKITPDLLGNIVREYVLQVGTDSVMLATSDETCVYTVATVNQAFNLRGPKPEKIALFTDKILMKQALKPSGVRLPKYIAFDKSQYLDNSDQYLVSLEKVLPYPLIAKPTNQVCSVGISLCRNRAELEKCVNDLIQNNYQFEIEEYIEGTVFHCDSIIKDGQILYTDVAECNVPPMSLAQGLVVGSIYIPRTDPRWDLIAKFNKKVIVALSPPDGATHLEVFYTPNNELIFLEIAARPVGSLASFTHEKNNGINFEEIYFKYQFGLSVSIEEKPSNIFHAWAYLPKKNGKVTHLNKPQLKSNYEIKWLVKVGEVIENSKDFSSQSELAGIITLSNPNYEELYRDFFSLNSLKFIDIHND